MTEGERQSLQKANRMNSWEKWKKPYAQSQPNIELKWKTSRKKSRAALDKTPTNMHYAERIISRVSYTTIIFWYTIDNVLNYTMLIKPTNGGTKTRTRARESEWNDIDNNLIRCNRMMFTFQLLGIYMDGKLAWAYESGWNKFDCMLADICMRYLKLLLGARVWLVQCF